MAPMRYPISNVAAYAWVLSDTFSLQWDIVWMQSRFQSLIILLYRIAAIDADSLSVDEL